MSTQRTIRKVIRAQKVNMGGIILDQALPVRGVDQVDPILLIHHLKSEVQAGADYKTVGVGPHPHRGFSPVTFVFEGSIHHRDSLGTSSIVRAGGTQYMFSGNGIVHSERPSKELAAAGGTWEIIQFWVNAPSKLKMTDPIYTPLQQEETPVIKSLDGKIKVGVVSGDFIGRKGPVEFMSDVLALRIEAQAEGDMVVPIPKGHNALIYVLDGSLKINGEQHLGAKDMAWFANDGDEIIIQSEANTRAIILGGAPINEEVVSYGPFVMNSQQEIVQALQDYQDGKMGTLVEKFED
jgi:redox-sensitive bicupin YhaK (pirin superfamily)